MARNVVVTTIVAVIMGGFVLAYTTISPDAQSGMSGMKQDASKAPRFPPVSGYAEGQEVYFIHSEASDPKIAKMLTNMMGGSPVLVVESLAKAPKEMMATVYVFGNGVKGGGPMGFQPDVFDHPPGTPGYSPLRAIHQVRWKDPSAARELESAEEVRRAEASGEIAIATPGIVVNMPMLTWPGGKR
ncbi:MAG: hypothetical protein M3541_07415 [Acidobacteriota bacterium]|nr:hypothetical protein [Acidobacteriota bacterium]